MSHVDEVRSPFLRKAIEHRRYRGQSGYEPPDRRALFAAPRTYQLDCRADAQGNRSDLPLEAAIVRREAELGRSLTELETKVLQVGASAKDDRR